MSYHCSFYETFEHTQNYFNRSWSGMHPKLSARDEVGIEGIISEEIDAKN